MPESLPAEGPARVTTVENAARAITQSIAAQRVDPFSITNFRGIAPPINWNSVARAAIKALRTNGNSPAERIFDAMLDNILKES